MDNVSWAIYLVSAVLVASTSAFILCDKSDKTLYRERYLAAFLGLVWPLLFLGVVLVSIYDKLTKKKLVVWGGDFYEVCEDCHKPIIETMSDDKLTAIFEKYNEK